MLSGRILPSVRRNVIPQGSKRKPSKEDERKSDFDVLVRFLSLLFNSEEGGSMFCRNVGGLYQITWRHMQEYGTFHSHCLEIISSQIMSVIVLYLFCQGVITYMHLRFIWKL
jgi:hypothetical protein